MVPAGHFERPANQRPLGRVSQAGADQVRRGQAGDGEDLGHPGPLSSDRARLPGRQTQTRPPLAP